MTHESDGATSTSVAAGRVHSEPPRVPHVARSVAWLLAAVLAGFLANLPALDAGFVYDDRFVIEMDPRIQSLEDPLRFFREGYWAVQEQVLDESGPPPLYRPLTSLSFAVDHAWHGLEPRGYHLTNLGLHALAVLLCFAVARSLGWSVGGAGVAATYFAVMGIHVEAVVQCIGRAELWAAIGVFAMVWCHRCQTAWAVLPAALAFAVGMLGKESAVVGLALVVGLDLIAPVDRSARLLDRLRPYRWIAYVMVLAAVLWLRHRAIGLSTPDAHERINPLIAVDAGERLLRGGQLLLQYAAQCFAPVSLAAEYTPNGVRGIGFGTRGGMLLVPAAAVLLLCVGWRTRGPGAVWRGLGWYLLAFSVTCNALMPIGTLMGDRLAYLPSFGVCLLLAALLPGAMEWSRPGRTRPVALILVVVFLAFQGVCSYRYASVWTDDVRVLETAVRNVPDSPRNRELLAGALIDRAQRAAREQRFPDALADTERAVTLHDDDALIRHVYARLLLQQGRRQEAAVQLRAVRELAPPDHPLAREAEAILRQLSGR